MHGLRRAIICVVVAEVAGVAGVTGVTGVAGQRHLESKQQVMEDDEQSALVQPVYTIFPLGSINPLGWLKDQLELEANGLAGNMFEFYRFVNDSKWIGGTTEYSILDEASPYWFNGLVPLAFGLNSTRIQGQVRYYLDYVLDHQQSDGWLGFETTRETRGLWARCLLLLGLMQYAEADPTQTERIVDSIHRYVELAHSMLKDNYTGLLVHGDDVFDTAGFGVGRTHEYHIPLQWLYEKYPRNNSQVIWETMELMINGGVLWGADWRTFFVDGVYPTVYYDGVTPWNLSWVFLHGVNHAEGLRYPLAIYRMTHDEKLKEQTRFATDLISKYHKSLSGSIIADEYISDLNPNRGAELCIAAELIFSLTWIYQYLADNDLADWVEQVAFNALPASLSPDWYSHQYVQQENQPWSRNLTEGSAMWTDVNSYSNVFGLEPNYPCCTVNHPQGYPKFLANSFVGTEDGGIAHVYLSPGTLSTTLKNDNPVTITATGIYPFGLNLKYHVASTKAFSFYVRIPTWAGNASSVTGPEEQPRKLIAPTDKGLQKVDVPAGESTFTVDLNTQPRVEPRANNTVGLYYGALLYSLAIDYNDTVVAARQYNTEAILPANTTDEHSHDHIMVPTSLWNIAIDPDQIKVVQQNVISVANPVWTLGGPPVELRVAAVQIEWPLLYDTPDIPPVNPVVKGEPFSARFVPYASAKLHMAHLPVVSLPFVNLEVTI
ncbi:duf1680 domain-containing protein [Truncatella angustata]|uniref:Duf1680 domain-containing protein n=1 Tax=Truncatella angustata TaxID=152316 RepID=A0A9P8RE90_9PEZI|nr:duf1680 domain-containing protein [Truncatella angustata]KAH6638519.1 duf1680 domain-containing protein [Truncatella angustata]KAH8197081.1 hypothetical protein TruAng_008751 [Truncatella angustata]